MPFIPEPVDRSSGDPCGPHGPGRGRSRHRELDPGISGESHGTSQGRHRVPSQGQGGQGGGDKGKITTSSPEQETPKIEGVSVMLYNTRTLFEESNRTLLDALISTTDNPDVILITESKLHETVPDGAVEFAGYDIPCRLDRVAVHPGGGLLIMTKKGLKFHNAKMKNVNFSCQVASIQIIDTVIVLVYRRPLCTKNQDQQLTSYLVNTYGGQKVILAGDFNLPGIDFDRLATADITTGENKSVVELWKDTITELQLEQTVKDPTHNLGNILDFVFHRPGEETLLEHPVVHPDMYLGFSDHFPITFSLKIEANIARERTFIFDMKNMNFEMYRQILENCDLLDRINAALTADEKWLILRNAILIARKLSCPVIEIKDHSRPSWLNRKIFDLKKQILRVRKKLKANKGSLLDQSNRNKRLKKLNLELKNEVSAARLSFDHKLVDKIENDKNYLFKHVKGVKRGNNRSPPINGVEGQPLANSASKAREFQKKFMMAFNTDEVEPRIWANNVLSDVDLSPSRIKSKVFSMNQNAACGLDTIGVKLYREAPFEVFIALSEILNRCFNMDELPVDWSLAKVIPLWKNSGSKFDIDKYRPVSLCITAMKIAEAMFLEDVSKLAEDQDVFGDQQHGFRSGRSTVTNLTQYWDHITATVDRNVRVYVLNLDMSKAFDGLKIDFILNSLSDLGIGGNLGRFITRWLCNRFQCVEVDGNMSDLQKVQSGVQQGSLNGPILYNLAAAKVTSGLRGRGVKFFQYADDLKLVFEAESATEVAAIQEALDELVSMSKEAGLSFNSTKSTLMAFGGRDEFHYPVALQMGGQDVEIVKEAKDLGLYFQSNMSFSATLNNNLKKAMSIVHIVRTTVKVKTLDILKRIYQSYFLPIITYGSEVFGSEMAMVKSAMHKGYKAFWRLSGGRIRIPDDIIDPFQECIVKGLCFFKRVQADKTCLQFSDHFKFVESTTRANHKQDLEIGMARKNARFNFFSNMVSRWYNQLDPNVRGSCGFQAFKAEAIRFVKNDHPTPPFDLRPKYLIWKDRGD